VVIPHKLLFQGQPVTYLALMLNWGSSLLVALASEAVGLKVHGTCSKYFIQGCAVALGVSPKPMAALVVLLGVLVVLLLLLLWFLKGWETGVYANPWSVAGMASLMVDGRVRGLLEGIEENNPGALVKTLKEKRFRLGYTKDGNYGVVLADETSQRLLEDDNRDICQADRNIHTTTPSPKTKKKAKFSALTYRWRILAIIAHTTILALVAFYHARDASLDLVRFGFGFGFRFLFAGIGQLLSLFWSSFFLSKCLPIYS